MIEKISFLPWTVTRKMSRRSIFNQFVNGFDELCKVVGQRFFATDLLIGNTGQGKKLAAAKRQHYWRLNIQIARQPRVRMEQNRLSTLGL